MPKNKKAKPQNFIRFLSILPKSFTVLKNSDPLRMAGATAFFTVFALPAILIIIIQLFGLFINPQLLDSELMTRLTEILGKEGATQIRLTLINFRGLAENWYITIAGFLFLVFVATTLFNIIKNSFDQIWNIRVESHPGILFLLKIRTKSFIVILLAGILFLGGIFTEGLEVFLGKNLEDLFPGAGKLFQGLTNGFVSAIIFTSWFVVLFRYIADGIPGWRATIWGGILTGTLFTVGKLFIKWGLSHSNLTTLYGASGSIVLLLLFVFYSSFVLYYGACFIKVYSEEWNDPLLPVNKAYRYQLKETV
jgi:membrane protein